MRVLFTKNRWPLSRLIRLVTKEDCSHVAFVFDEKLVIEATVFGVGTTWLPTFEKQNQIIHGIEYTLRLEKEEAVYRAVLDSIHGKRYDWGLIFGSLWGLTLSRVFKLPRLAINPTESQTKYACIEVISEIALRLPAGIIQSGLTREAVTMMTPHELYESLTYKRRT